MDVDLSGLERQLCQIPEVRAARIVADVGGKPIEVHVLASPGKHAKQLVRDVQSVAMATIGLEIDHRIVSVVQLDDGTMVAAPDDAGQASPAETGGGNSAQPGTERVLVEAVTAIRTAAGVTVEVALRRGDEVTVGTAEGTAAGSVLLRLAAQATLLALQELEPVARRIEIEAASIARIGDRHVAVTTLVLMVPPHEEAVTGSALVRPSGEHDAVARSVLDALNRRLVRLR